MKFLVLSDRQGLVFMPMERVAMVRPEWDRFEVLSADEVLGHSPLPPSLPWLAEVGEALVNLSFARPEGDGWQLPGGWLVTGEVTGGARPPEWEDPWLEKVGVRASEVLYLTARRAPDSTWMTVRGERPAGAHENGAALARWHPDLVRAGRNHYINPRRARFLRRVDGRRAFRLTFDEGSALELSEPAAAKLALALGIEDPDELPGQRDALMRWFGMRRWPLRLAEAKAAFLTSEFAGDPERLVANLLMQTVEGRRRGEALRDGDHHRGYYYFPVRPAFQRAGYMVNFYPKKPRVPLESDEAYGLMCTVCTRLVEGGLFGYRELGFKAAHPEYRLVGRTRPEVVLFVEKETLLSQALGLHEERGVSVFVSGGLPPLIGAEYFAAELGLDEVVLVSYCDFDVVGFDLPLIHADHLARYGVRVREVRRMVQPDLFTAEEIALLAVPIETEGPPNWRARVERWLRETGGVDGQALAIHADHLQPFSRVVEAFDRAVG
ncbi:MAG: hypothetical protein AB7S38_40195 [Vulcanimicrobiota bacterium]